MSIKDVWGWVTGDTKRIAAEEAESNRLAAEQAYAKLADDQQTQIDELKNLLANIKADPNADKKSSSEPWVEIVGDKWDDVHGLEIKLDWNDAFVVQLRELGIAGKDDDTIVHKWLAMLYEDIINKLEDGVVDRRGEADQYV